MRDIPRILFICTGNAGRSQMAQAMCRAIAGDSVIIESAGVGPWPHLHPLAVQLMGERGLDVSAQYPKHVTDVTDRVFDLVVTIGDPAQKQTPLHLPGQPTRVHWDIADPADADDTPDSEAVFRRTAENIEARLPELVEAARQLTSCSRASRRPGVGTGVWFPEPFAPKVHLPQAVAHGFAAIELNLYLGLSHFDHTDEKTVAELKTVADDLGISVWSIHSPKTDASLGAPDPAERRTAEEVLRTCLDLAQTLEARVVISHDLGAPVFSDDPSGSVTRSREMLDGLAGPTMASGARVAFENMSTTQEGQRAVDTLDRVRELPEEAFGFVLDTGHSNMADDLSDVAEAVGNRLISLHLNDNDGQNDQHIVPGEGTVAWHAVAGLLRAVGYEGCAMYEVFSAGRESKVPVEALRATMEAHQQALASFCHEFPC